MGFVEYVVDGPLWAASRKCGGRSLGRLKLMWAQIIACDDRWQPHDLAHIVFHWRGLTVGMTLAGVVKFIEVIAGYHRFAIVWFGEGHKTKEFAVIDRLQWHYDNAHNRRSKVDEDWADGRYGLQIPPERCTHDMSQREDGLLNGYNNNIGGL